MCIRDRVPACFQQLQKFLGVYTRLSCTICQHFCAVDSQVLFKYCRIDGIMVVPKVAPKLLNKVHPLNRPVTVTICHLRSWMRFTRSPCNLCCYLLYTSRCV